MQVGNLDGILEKKIGGFDGRIMTFWIRYIFVLNMLVAQYKKHSNILMK